MNYLLFAIFSAFGVYLASRSSIAVVDNVKIGTGLTDDTTNISGSSEVIAVKNNNPLNIRESKDNWQGLASPRANKGFFNFTKPEYGYRAAKIIVLNSYASRGVTTLRQVISTWAPPSENSTESYISFVSDKSGISPESKITSGNIAKLFYAMTIIETGKALPMSTVEKGLTL